eukprot:8803417-Karenia_brevis.AAC.1
MDDASAPAYIAGQYEDSLRHLIYLRFRMNPKWNLSVEACEDGIKVKSGFCQGKRSSTTLACRHIA